MQFANQIYKDYEEAKRLLTEALAVMPRYPEAKHALEQIRWLR
ncbi:hypothetical protein C5S32_11860 [ANME-1 cluster archaeon GoMg1]|nr:hypothetical protein [ANME-1 cluster archaeon GoMg1]